MKKTLVPYIEPECNCIECQQIPAVRESIKINVLRRNNTPTCPWLEKFQHDNQNTGPDNYKISDLEMLVHPYQNVLAQVRSNFTLSDIQSSVEEDGIERYLSIDDAKAIRKTVKTAVAFQKMFGKEGDVSLAFWKSTAITKMSGMIRVPIMYVKKEDAGDRLVIQWVCSRHCVRPPLILLSPRLPSLS